MHAGEFDVHMGAFGTVGDAGHCRGLLVCRNVASVHVCKCGTVLIDGCVEGVITRYSRPSKVEHVSSADWTRVDATVPIVHVLRVHQNSAELDDSVSGRSVETRAQSD